MYCTPSLVLRVLVLSSLQRYEVYETIVTDFRSKSSHNCQNDAQLANKKA